MAGVLPSNKGNKVPDNFFSRQFYQNVKKHPTYSDFFVRRLSSFRIDTLFGTSRHVFAKAFPASLGGIGEWPGCSNIEPSELRDHLIFFINFQLPSINYR